METDGVIKVLDKIRKNAWLKAKHYEKTAKEALTNEVEMIYRAKAAEAMSFYVEITNMKLRYLRERARDKGQGDDMDG